MAVVLPLELEALTGNLARHTSNSLQLIKKLQRGLLQTKRHLWFSSLAPQQGQYSHQLLSCHAWAAFGALRPASFIVYL
jgi:hypothetical protein